MKALVLRGKQKGKEFEVSQWCNNWFTLNSDLIEVATKPFNPSSLAFTAEGIETVKNHHNNGVLFEEYEVVPSKAKKPYGFTFRKIKYPPRNFLTPEQAKDLLPEGKEIHVYHNPNGSMLVGFDVSRKRVLKAIDSAETIEVGGQACMNMKHGIVVIPKDAKLHSEIWFVNHDEEKMKKYD